MICKVVTALNLFFSYLSIPQSRRNFPLDHFLSGNFSHIALQFQSQLFPPQTSDNSELAALWSMSGNFKFISFLDFLHESCCEHIWLLTQLLLTDSIYSNIFISNFCQKFPSIPCFISIVLLKDLRLFPSVFLCVLLVNLYIIKSLEF